MTGSAPFAVWNVAPDVGPSDRVGWGVRALGGVLFKGSFYVLWAPALLGVWRFPLGLRRAPGAWVFLVVALVLAALLYRVAQACGYLGERHALLILLGIAYWGVAGLGVLGCWLAAILPGGLSGRRVGLALLLALAVAPLARTLAPLHADRAGYRQAGAWLAAHTLPGDEVVDPYAWAGYYAGRVFREGQAGLPAGDPPVLYVVLDEHGSRHPHLWWLVPAAERLARAGTEVQRFPVRAGRRESAVVVYKVPRPAGPLTLPVAPPDPKR